MKLNYKSIILGCFIAFSVSSACKKDDPTPTPAPVSNGTMNASLNGNAWSAKTLQNTLIKATDDIGDVKRLDIRGTAADGKMIIVTLADYSTGKQGDGVALKTYHFEKEGEDALFTYKYGDVLTHMPHSGSVTITANNASSKTISGSFTFESRDMSTGDTLRVTNGAFTDVKYTVHQ